MARLPITVEERSWPHRLLRFVGLAALIALVFWVPASLETFRLSQITTALVICIAAVGLNLLAGFNGQISLGHVAFFGLGAYTAGIVLVHNQVAPLWTILAAAVLCAVVGFAVGAPALRLRGLYVVMITLAVGVAFEPLVRRYKSLTGGSLGISGWRFDPPSMQYFVGRPGQAKGEYWVSIVVLTVAVALVANIMKGRSGRAIRALRDNEFAATIMGVNRTVVATAVFGISAGITGAAGSIYALRLGLLTPDPFDLLWAISLIVAVFIGGAGTLSGPVVGGLFVTLLPAWTSGSGGDPLVSGVIFGATLILFAFVLPGGLVGGVRSLTRLAIRIEPARIPEKSETHPTKDRALTWSQHEGGTNEVPTISRVALVEQPQEKS
jgi:branched-chain amino acid transport system permease protein